MRFIHLSLLFTLASGVIAAHALEVSPPCSCNGGRAVEVVGTVIHYSHSPGVTVVGAQDASVFASEIYGQDFTARVGGLTPGTYTVDITEAETFTRTPGQRVMTITSGSAVLADRLDLDTVAGFAHEYHVIGKVHLRQGPLSIHFLGLQDNAMFDAIKILDENQNEVAYAKAGDFGDPGYLLVSKIPIVKEPPIFRDPAQPLDARVNDLIRRLSLGEKVAQLQTGGPSIQRLGIRAYDYWSEACHGVALHGLATVFPQGIGVGATWDAPLVHEMGDVVSTEARAKFNENRDGDHGQFNGLTLWAPNINIFRDPRWGRGQETYGEDPWLTSRMAVAYIRGLQGDDPKYLKTVACAKHYAVHSGPEALRHSFNTNPPERDLYETYLPQFEAAVREAKVGQVMSAYSAVYGVPAPASSFLLTDILRKKWGFDGYVVSDCDAVEDIVTQHHYDNDMPHAVADAVKAGTDVNCGRSYQALVQAVVKGLLTEGDIDTALRRALTIRFRLGLFDPPDYAYAKIPPSQNDTPEHAALALRVARESMVLLKNDGVLPLDKTKLRKVAVVGPNADNAVMQEGSYHGEPSHPISILQGIRNELESSGVQVIYSQGCGVADENPAPVIADTVQKAADGDVIVFVGGIQAEVVEGEAHDRDHIELPAAQEALIKALAATGKPVIFVNCSGSAVAMRWEAMNLPAILQAWYPGENGGTAVADVLFGNYNPAGRLPVTFYDGTAELPDFSDYSMANRTYRYFNDVLLYAFGYGLSYTHFTYGAVKLRATKADKDGNIHLGVNVSNDGAMDGDEVVQVYARHLKSKWPQPVRSLVAFRRVHIGRGQATAVNLDFAAQQLRCWDAETKAYVIEPGTYEIQVGAASDDIRGSARINL